MGTDEGEKQKLFSSCSMAYGSDGGSALRDLQLYTSGTQVFVSI